MNNFTLDQRLDNDCFILSESNEFIFLLLNNSLIPWFILVPKTDKTEFSQLDIQTQHNCLDQINIISKFITDEYKPDKLNTATIGNIVNQLHIHIVGRFESDPFWPGVVWGNNQKESYTKEQVEDLKMKFKQSIDLPIG